MADRVALVVVDAQRAFCHPDGSVARTGLDTRAAARAVASIVDLVSAARKGQAPVVFTRYALAPDWSNAGLLAEVAPRLHDVRGLVQGTEDVELVPELVPRADELVVDKTRYSAFWGTPLRSRLAEREVRTVVLCGVTTNVCVAATARDAFAHDLRVVVAEDATADVTPDLHDAALRSIEYGIGIVEPSREAAGRLVASLRRAVAAPVKRGAV